MEQLIRQYHKGQFRNDKGNYLPAKLPYTDHLIGVETILATALRLFGECRDPQLKEDMRAAALGHDLLEDTEVTEEEIIRTANPRVLKLIKELTNPVDDYHTEQYMLQLSNASEEARLIKYADLIENIASVCYYYHIVGREWTDDFFRPILNQTIPTLRDTAFPTYPKTADYLRDMLETCVQLLRAKEANAERQYPVRVLRSCREAIPEAELNRHIDKAKADLRSICRSFSEGRITHDEEKRCINNAFLEGFDRYLGWSRLNMRFNESSWTRFLEDHLLWKSGNEPTSHAGSPWLVYDDGVEASALDKLSFFRLMDTYLIPVEYFKPIPNRCIQPKRRINMYGTGPAGTVEFSLTDDGGLSSDADPVGKAYTLTDETGLKANVKIIRLATEEDNNNNRFVATYIGEGIIEGYTSARVRPIDISRIWEDRTVYFYLCIENDDLDTYYDFPLWQEYHNFCAQWHKVCDQHLQALMDCYDKRSEDAGDGI